VSLQINAKEARRPGKLSQASLWLAITISATVCIYKEPRAEIDNDERIGHMLSLMKSKAGHSLKARHGPGAAEVH
jgi:hypothetical protein